MTDTAPHWNDQLASRHLAEARCGLEDDRGRLEQTFRARAERLATSQPPAPATRPALTVRVRAALCCIDLDAIAYVGKLSGWATLPDAPPELLGLVAWRGSVVPLFDVARALGPAHGGDAATHLVVLSGRPPLALAVGAPEGVVEIDQHDLDRDTGPAATHWLPGSGLTRLDAARLREKLLGPSEVSR